MTAVGAVVDATDDGTNDIGECPRCFGLAPIGGDCPEPKCVAFAAWATAHQEDEEP